MTAHHLAQLNVARMKAPLESPLMAAFSASLDQISELADGSPGFVWRLKDEAGDTTSLRPFGDEMLVNVSVWATIDELANFVYRSTHADVMKRRRDWFDRIADTYTVLWWIPSGHKPTIAEARERLAELRRCGPAPRAFPFRQSFSADGTQSKTPSTEANSSAGFQ